MISIFKICRYARINFGDNKVRVVLTTVATCLILAVLLSNERTEEKALHGKKS